VLNISLHFAAIMERTKSLLFCKIIPHLIYGSIL